MGREGTLRGMITDAGIDVAVQLSPPVHVKVKVPVFVGGSSTPELLEHSYDMRSKETVLQLKVTIAQEEAGFPSEDDFTILKNSTPLSDDATLASAGITANDVLTIGFAEGCGVSSTHKRALDKQKGGGSQVQEEARTKTGLTLVGLRQYLSYGATWQNLGGTLLFWSGVETVKIVNANLYQRNLDPDQCFICDQARKPRRTPAWELTPQHRVWCLR